ncbi:MAG: molecular chaperone [Phycisphaerales bacterium]
MIAATPDPVLCSVNRVLAQALSRALRDTCGTSSPSDNKTLNGELISAAWAVLADEFGDLRPESLGLGETAPHRDHARGLIDWLALNPRERDIASQDIFGLVMSKECPPNETEYCHWKDPTYRANQLADIAGFYSAFGVEPSQDDPERPDHISLELEFVGFLNARLAAHEREQDERLQTDQDALRAFLRDHVAWWVPTFGQLLERHIDRRLNDTTPEHGERLRRLRGVARALRAWVATQRVILGEEPSRRIIAPQVGAPPPEADTDCAACNLSVQS